jgi:serine/threonine-protein kinase
LKAAGLKKGHVSYKYTQSNDHKGHVITQDPSPGININKGQPVDFTVSRGIRMVAVPDVVDQSLAEAKQKLASHHLKVGPVKKQHSGKDANTVLAQKPQPTSSKVPAQTKVALTVSDGKVQVPKVIGLDPARAATKLGNAGFQINTGKVRLADQPDGVVVRQRPGGGRYASKGSTVSISVNERPRPSPTPTPNSPTPTPNSPTPTPTSTSTTSPSSTPSSHPSHSPSHSH